MREGFLFAAGSVRPSLRTGPIPMSLRILITSALPYVNGIKHLGNLVGSLLPADASVTPVVVCSIPWT